MKHATDEADRLIAEGNRAEDAGRLAEACTVYGKAVRAAPGYAKAHLNLGIALEALGRFEEAAASYGAALAVDGANPYAHYNLGKLLYTRGALEPAASHLQAALERRPQFPEAAVVLASLREAQGDFSAAARLLKSALEQRPELAGAWYNYALVLMKLDCFGDAEAAVRRALALDPDLLPAYRFLGDLLRTDGRHEEAVELYAVARQNAGAGIEYEQATLHALNHSDRVSEEALFARHREVGARLEAAHPARFPFRNAREPERRLRVGYVSRDFHQHPVAWFMVPVLAGHEGAAFEVHCYSRGTKADAMTSRLRGLADHWHDAARLSHDEFAQTIHSDGIDILVDLLGHCADSDLAVFAAQPAPVQVSWLGYLNTTGLTRMHYRLTDAASDPPGRAEHLHTETLIRLPHSQWCYRPVLNVEHAATPPVIRNGFVTFGSFNHLLKISATTRELWKRILKALPQSRLVMLGVPPGPARERLVAEFGAAGVPAGRLTLVPSVPLEDYFRWFDAVDLALDPTPYSGGTTTCDTLWMGVPVITLPGSRSASRSAASILGVLGMHDCIARSAEEYVRRALDFAAAPAKLATLRASLRAKMHASALMDEPAFIHALEGAYRDIWRRWCAGSR